MLEKEQAQAIESRIWDFLRWLDHEGLEVHVPENDLFPCIEAVNLPSRYIEYLKEHDMSEFREWDQR